VQTRSVWVPAGTTRSVTLIGAAHHQPIAAGTSWSPDQEGLLATVSVRPVIGSTGHPIGYEAYGYNGTTQGHFFLLHVSFDQS
jgi:hypothetical protein